MPIFQREDLRSKGYTEDQINDLMAMVNTGLQGYLPLTELQGRIDAALKDHKPDPIDPKTTSEYQQLATERDMLRLIGGEDFASVKPKFREAVFGMLDRGEKAKPIAEQLKSIGEKYEEYFQPAQPKPAFGSSDQGSMPKGDEGAVAAFDKAFGFVPRK